MGTGANVAYVSNVEVDGGELWVAGTAGYVYGGRASTSGTPRYVNFHLGALL